MIGRLKNWKIGKLKIEKLQDCKIARLKIGKW
jgi:hypothetical protein